MAKYKPNYWRDPDNPEPIDYAIDPDPLQGGAFESGRDDLIHFAKVATECFKSWIEDHSRNLDSMLALLKNRWLEKGGNDDTWETIILMANRDSNYAKTFSKEANAAVKETPLFRPVPFNTLDLSALKDIL